MPTCTEFVKGTRRCGALAEPGHTRCVVHLKASGMVRCGACGAWVREQRWHQGSCPNAGPAGPRDIDRKDQTS